MIAIYNVTTGEITEREPNAAELAQQAADLATMAARQEAEAANAAAKAALFERLGISEDEAKLLLS